MGYYSDVALKVTRHDETHGIPMRQLWAQFVREKNDPAIGQWIDQIDFDENTWTFHAEGVKWYGDEQFGFPEVRYIEDWRNRMLLLAETHPQIYSYSWVIVGEEQGDVESQYRGDYNDYVLTAVTTSVGL